MRKTLLLSLLAILLISAVSCGKCFVSDCEKDDVRFVYYFSATDSTDLIASGKYLLDSLKVTTLKLNPNGTAPSYEVSFTEKYIAIQATPNAAGYVLQLDTLPPDTLLVDVALTKDSDCCDGVNVFEGFQLNGTAVPNGATTPFVTILK